MRVMTGSEEAPSASLSRPASLPCSTQREKRLPSRGTVACAHFPSSTSRTRINLLVIHSFACQLSGPLFSQDLFFEKGWGGGGGSLHEFRIRSRLHTHI